MPTASSSSSPSAEERLVRVPIGCLQPHPANPNRMSEDQIETLARNVDREGRYPPLVVRPTADSANVYQLLDGAQRLAALQRLGHETALCYVWECDDRTALVLLATLNRLHGEDVPVRRAELVAELAAMMPMEELSLLLPEDAGAIDDLLALLDLDTERLLADLTAANSRASSGLRSISFAVSAEDEQLVEEAIEQAGAGLEGKNRRGRALATTARAYLEGSPRA